MWSVQWVSIMKQSFMALQLETVHPLSLFAESSASCVPYRPYLWGTPWPTALCGLGHAHSCSSLSPAHSKHLHLYLSIPWDLPISSGPCQGWNCTVQRRWESMLCGGILDQWGTEVLGSNFCASPAPHPHSGCTSLEGDLHLTIASLRKHSSSGCLCLLPLTLSSSQNHPGHKL